MWTPIIEKAREEGILEFKDAHHQHSQRVSWGPMAADCDGIPALGSLEPSPLEEYSCLGCHGDVSPPLQLLG